MKKVTYHVKRSQGATVKTTHHKSKASRKTVPKTKATNKKRVVYAFGMTQGGFWG